MKKILSMLLVSIFMLTVAACGNSEEETTEAETHPPVEITTGKTYTLEEMSPDEIDLSYPEYIETEISRIDFDSLTEIDAADSVLPKAGHDKILEGENVQYFFVDGDIKIHAIFFDENKNITCSASYNTSLGYIEFIGTDSISWYFNENGEFSCAVYSFSGDTNKLAPIYTFYNENREKEVTRTVNGWYSPSFDLLSQEDTLVYIQKYSFTIEATATY